MSQYPVQGGDSMKSWMERIIKERDTLRQANNEWHDICNCRMADLNRFYRLIDATEADRDETLRTMGELLDKLLDGIRYVYNDEKKPDPPACMGCNYTAAIRSIKPIIEALEDKRAARLAEAEEAFKNYTAKREAQLPEAEEAFKNYMAKREAWLAGDPPEVRP